MTIKSPGMVLGLFLWFFFGPLASSLEAAEPTPLFESTLCRLLGCAVVYNGQQWQLYVLTGETGRPARLWASSDGQPAIGTIEADQRGTPSLPGARQGSVLGIDLDGDQEADVLVDSGAEGFLDAGASLAPFPVTATTELSLAQRELQHSFWVASNAPLAIHGEARLIRQEGALAAGFAANEVAVELEVGSADGQVSGVGAAPAGVEREPSLGHLADLMGGPRRILTLRPDTVEVEEADVRRRLLRIALRYHFAGYDLSQGMGELAAEVEYSIYNP